jgi:hypothetical protein
MACESHGNYDATFHPTHQSRAQLAIFPSSLFCLSSLLSQVFQRQYCLAHDANMYVSVPPPEPVPIMRGEEMEPDDLLGSRNARPPKV